MSGTFNAYHVWLGIPAHEQPPNFYRLLGITDFESDLDVIDHAADRQMAHVRTFQGGRHAALSQQILNELAAARLGLLDAEKKAAYDEQLRAKLAGAPHATAVPVAKALPVGRAIASGGPIPTAPVRRTPVPSSPVPMDPVKVAQPAAHPAPRAARESDDEISIGFDPLVETPRGMFDLRRRRRLYRRGSSWSREINLAIVAGLAVATFLGLYWFYRIVSSGKLWEYVEMIEHWDRTPPASAPAEPEASPLTPPAAPPAPAAPKSS